MFPKHSAIPSHSLAHQLEQSTPQTGNPKIGISGRINMRDATNTRASPTWTTRRAIPAPRLPNAIHGLHESWFSTQRPGVPLRGLFSVHRDALSPDFNRYDPASWLQHKGITWCINISWISTTSHKFASPTHEQERNIFLVHELHLYYGATVLRGHPPTFLTDKELFSLRAPCTRHRPILVPIEYLGYITSGTTKYVRPHLKLLLLLNIIRHAREPRPPDERKDLPSPASHATPPSCSRKPLQPSRCSSLQQDTVLTFVKLACTAIAKKNLNTIFFVYFSIVFFLSILN